MRKCLDISVHTDIVSHDLKFCHFATIFWGASRGLGPSKIDAGKKKGA